MAFDGEETIELRHLRCRSEITLKGISPNDGWIHEYRSSSSSDRGTNAFWPPQLRGLL